MNNLSDDICDILAGAIFHTRVAQVYLAGNNITPVSASAGIAVLIFFLRTSRIDVSSEMQPDPPHIPSHHCSRIFTV